MMQLLQRFLYPMLNKRRHLSEDELYRFVLIQAVAVVAASVHLMFAVFFFAAGSTLLGVSHSIGLLIFAAAFWLLQKRHYDLAGIIISVMILFSTLATIHVIGGNNFSILYQLIVLLMISIVPFSNRRLPMIASILLPFISLASYWYDLTHTPLMDIGLANEVLASINLFVCFSGVIILMSLERLVHGFLNVYHAEQMSKLEEQANEDPLTKLYNRRYADAFFARLRSDPSFTRACIAIADIDNFKQVNDTYGHDVGDLVLLNVASILSSYTRKDDMVFRWGGEEFLIILQDTGLSSATLALEKIRMLVQDAPILHEGEAISVSLTIGVAPLDPHDVARSLILCDRKLYEGKHSGKNKTMY